MPSRQPAGQVLVIVAFAIVVLLAAAGLTIDIGRQVAERRHIQTAADAGALAACRELIQGGSDNAAAAAARSVALANLAGSPAGGSATIAPDNARVYDDGHAGDPAFLASGILIAGTSVRVAVASSVETALARVVGVTTLETGAAARCALQGGPAVPIVARRYDGPPGPGGGFEDFMATAATSTMGKIDAFSAQGYDVRTPASEAVPGPEFALYGPAAKANNDSSFRGFIALDVRNFESTTSRVYYNGVTPGTSVNTLKSMQGAYILTGYPGPAFPPVSTPATGATQVATMNGNDSAHVVHPFDDVWALGDRVMLAVYEGTVMEIPDFSITPPTAIVLASTTGSPVNGPSFSVSRNDAFASTVTLHLHGDTMAANTAYDIVPTPSVTPPAAGDMNQPTWSTDTFVPAKNGTNVAMQAIRTNTIPAGIYTVWLEGHSGNPYFQTRRVPVPVRIGGAVRDFSFGNSTTSGAAANLGDVLTVPLYVSTTSSNSTKWGATGSAVSLSWDVASFSTCSLGTASLPAAQITFGTSSVTPTSSGLGAVSNLSINTAGLGPGCYSFVVRGTGTNGDSQPVTHLQPITFTVATSTSSGQYVDIIGFCVFEITDVDSNSIMGRAVTGVAADPNDGTLRRAQRARLLPWTD